MAKIKQSAILIRRGLNVPLAGSPDQSISPGNRVRSVALQGTDFVGLKPRMLTEEGESVMSGQALFCDKRDSDVQTPGRLGNLVTLLSNQRHGIPFEVLRVTASFSRYFCRRSPRHGILQP
jgi:Na+-transporting NADH:ubiquinone oxidoreductase subunit A